MSPVGGSSTAGLTASQDSVKKEGGGGGGGGGGGEDVEMEIIEEKGKWKVLREAELVRLRQQSLDDPTSIWNAAAYKRPAHLLFSAAREARRLTAARELRQNQNGDNLPPPLSAHDVILKSRGAAYQETLLHTACLFENFEVVAFLVREFPDLINVPYGEGRYQGETALHFAVVNGDVEMVKILLNHREGAVDAEAEAEVFVEMVSRDKRETNTTRTVHKDGKTTADSERRIVSSVVKPAGTTTTTRTERQSVIRDNKSSPAIPYNKRRISADPNCTVKGEFFSLSKKGTDTVYFGDHPLAFAVCLKRPERKEIIRLLIKHGARLDLTDRYGNNLLHLCVYHEDVEMYNYICDLFDLYKVSALRRLNNSDSFINEQDYDLEKFKNHKNRTPLNYAIKLGKQAMVKAILDRKRMVMWTFGPVASVAYPMDEIDTYDRFRTHQKSALTTLVYNAEKTPGTSHKAILDSTPFKEIMQKKWDNFAQRIFFVILAYYVLHLLAVVLLVVRPASLMIGAARGVVIYVCECFVLLNSVIILILQILEVSRLKGYILQEMGTLLFCMIAVTSSLLFFVALPLRLFQLERQEDLVVTTAGLLAFVYTLYFARGHKSIGYYVVVLRKTVLNDLVQFGAIYLVFLLGFALGFVAVFRDVETDLFESYPWTLLTLFKMTLFAFDDVTVQGTQNTGYAVTLLVIFTIVTGVLMLNLLVATLNHSYSAIKAESELQWHLERSLIILFLERILWWLLGRAGTPGSKLGLKDDKRHFLVVPISSDWVTDKSGVRLRQIFRQAIARVCMMFFRRRDALRKRIPGKGPASGLSQQTFVFREKSFVAFHPDEGAEKVVEASKSFPRDPADKRYFPWDLRTEIIREVLRYLQTQHIIQQTKRETNDPRPSVHVGL